MGDRANVAIVQRRDGKSEGAIFLYTHCHGCELPFIVQAALDRGRERWDHEVYLARVVFSEMIQDELFDDAGFGIALYPPEGQHATIVIDCASRTVGFTRGELESCYRLWGFDHYIRIPGSEIELAYQSGS